MCLFAYVCEFKLNKNNITICISNLVSIRIYVGFIFFLLASAAIVPLLARYSTIVQSEKRKPITLM